MIIFAARDRPFLRTGKGSVKSKPSLELYQTEMEACYKDFEAASVTTVPPPNDWSEDLTLAYIQAILAEALAVPTSEEIDPDKDIFVDFGATSLAATMIRSKIAAAVSTSGSDTKLPHTLVYEHPTAKSLAHAVLAVLSGVHVPPATTDWIGAMQALADKYTSNFPAGPPETNGVVLPNGHQKYTFLVTGTTGSLGCNLLPRLLAHPQVERVYAVNRPHSTKSLLERQSESLVSRGLSDKNILTSSKLVFVPVAWTSGMDAMVHEMGEDLYKGMVCSVTHIVHSAWMLDFNKPVQAFEDHIDGLRTLVDLAARCTSANPHGAHFIFMSSVAATQG